MRRIVLAVLAVAASVAPQAAAAQRFGYGYHRPDPAIRALAAIVGIAASTAIATSNVQRRSEDVVDGLDGACQAGDKPSCERLAKLTDPRLAQIRQSLSLACHGGDQPSCSRLSQMEQDMYPGSSYQTYSAPVIPAYGYAPAYVTSGYGQVYGGGYGQGYGQGYESRGYSSRSTTVVNNYGSNGGSYGQRGQTSTQGGYGRRR